ncbi:unnamed protein product [Polarella glacialis]|uniref:Uncharacterized protein n=1 Tax=Polarella glacialis TaxID=89957 RepID=A0A813HQT3_POLGL|nr:unnamed protein product [Polarella glacialis]
MSVAAQLRLVKAAALQTVLFPTESSFVKAGHEAGARYSADVKKRNGSQTLPPPHTLIFAVLLQATVLDPSLPTAVSAAVSQLVPGLQRPETFTAVVAFCKLSKCFDRQETRLEIAVTPQHFAVLQQLIDYWVSKGAVQRYGCPPRGPIERSLAHEINGSD